METNRELIVYVIDDDDSVLRSLQRLLRSAGFGVTTYASAQAFLNSDFQQTNVCLVVDVKMPQMSGLELYQELLDKGICMPIIFITAYDTEEIRRKARALGAVGYFRKPIDGQALIDSIHWGLSVSKDS